MDCHALLWGIFLTQGFELTSLMFPALAGRFLNTSTTWEAIEILSIKCPNLDTLSLTKEARIYNGLKTISLTNGAGKSGQPLVKGGRELRLPLELLRVSHAPRQAVCGNRGFFRMTHGGHVLWTLRYRSADSRSAASGHRSRTREAVKAAGRRS